jgi:hypothetical protein
MLWISMLGNALTLVAEGFVRTYASICSRSSAGSVVQSDTLIFWSSMVTVPILSSPKQVVEMTPAQWYQ